MASVQAKVSDGGERLGTCKSGKRKQTEESSSQSEVAKGKRRKATSKVIPKKKRQDLVKHLKAIELST